MQAFYLRRVVRGASTWGVLVDQTETPFALTGELPWKENKRNVSCIPPGEYLCSKRLSPARGVVFQLTKVAKRRNIQLHCGNVPTKDSRGCIIIGEEFSYLDKSCAVLSSRRAFKELLDKLDGDEQFILVVQEASQWVSR
jgi:hypothetical protein